MKRGACVPGGLCTLSIWTYLYAASGDDPACLDGSKSFMLPEACPGLIVAIGQKEPEIGRFKTKARNVKAFVLTPFGIGWIWSHHLDVAYRESDNL